MEERKKPERPYLFRLACYIGFIYFGLISLIFLIAFAAIIFNHELIKIYSDQYGIVKEGLLLTPILAFILFGLSFYSILLIWLRKKYGVYILISANIVITIVQLFYDSVNWMNILITLIIAIITFSYSKKL